MARGRAGGAFTENNRSRTQYSAQGCSIAPGSYPFGNAAASAFLKLKLAERFDWARYLSCFFAV